MARIPHRQRYAVFLESLVEARRLAGLTQAEVAERLDTTQTFVSKCERGERRLDVIDLLDFLNVFGTDAPAFVRDVEARLRRSSPSKRQSGREG